MYQEGSINIPNPLMKDDEKMTLPDIKTLRFSSKWNAVCPAHWKKWGVGGHSWTTKFGYKLFTAWTYYLNDTALQSMFVLDLESPAAIQMFFKINDVIVWFINKQAKCVFKVKI